MQVWIKRSLVATIVIAAAVGGAGYWALQQSLPQLTGDVQTQVFRPVKLNRDANGAVRIVADDRLDAAYALGFAHAQDRFFQMDLLRRNSAGELSELFGAKALEFDKARRMHRFRDRAELALANLPKQQRQLLDRYTDGVNRGLQSLGLAPFEYLLLTSKPQAWQPADSLLCIYSMYLDLQGAEGKDDLAQGVLKAAIPADWYQFFNQHSADWQAPLDDSLVTAVAVPSSPYPDALKPSTQACVKCQRRDSRDIGSNNFAVAASASKDGRAIVADDMHLGLRVPGIWYKAELNFQKDGQARRVAGVTLPGAPAIVAGSNGAVAWGFTNSTADWQDVVKLTVDSDGKRYKTPNGMEDFSYNNEVIKVKGQADEIILVKETMWGPVMAAPFSNYALRWVAYDKEGLNLNLLQLEDVQTVEDAIALAPTVGIPAQNLMVGDNKGQIGWTLIGAIPKRQLADMDTPQDWSRGNNFWDGYVDGSAYPKVLGKDRLWTANSRVVGGDALKLIGDGGYDLGARAAQIRNGLQASNAHTIDSVHQVQLDDKAVFLQRWRELALSVLTDEFVQQQQLQDYKKLVDSDVKAASIDSVGYSLVRAFRDKTLDQIFAPMAALLEQQQLQLNDLKLVPETAGWALIQAKRPDTLPNGVASWQALLQQAILQSRDELAQKAGGDFRQARWGLINEAHIQHPLSKAIPQLSAYLDMPVAPQSGDRHMPKVSGPAFGQSERMVVSPGHEEDGILVLPTGQSGHPLSEFYHANHQDWLGGQPTPFLPGAEKYQLILQPQG